MRGHATKRVAFVCTFLPHLKVCDVCCLAHYQVYAILRCILCAGVKLCAGVDRVMVSLCVGPLLFCADF